MVQNLIIIIIGILFSIFNGYVINWKLTNDPDLSKKYSKIWHTIGFFINILLVILITMIGGWIWGLITFFLNWFGHNIIIAIIMGQKWYIGTTSWFDKMIRKLLPCINFDE